MRFFERISSSLKKHRNILGLTYADLERHGLYHDIAHNIEDGKNCSIDKLFLYMDALNGDALSRFVLQTGPRQVYKVSSKEDLAKILKDLRVGKHITLIGMCQRSGITEGQVLKIEQAKGYTLRTLGKYFEAVGGIEKFDSIIY